MVYATLSPETLRFKHVAGHILAQTVATRALSIRLMQQVQTAALHRPLMQAIQYVYGINRGLFQGPVQPTFDASNTALAYLTAAAMHPDQAIRDKCRAALKNNLDWDINKIGNDLVSWFLGIGLVGF